MGAPFNEMYSEDGESRAGYEFLDTWLRSTAADKHAQSLAEAELLFRRIGITFAVYGATSEDERIIPFDIIPRILLKSEWRRLASGLEQRIKALNLFLADIYERGEILKAGAIPPDLIYRNPYFRPEMVGFKPPHDIHIHIAGIDIVRVDAEAPP